MPYKNIEDRREASRRWYRNNYPKSKNHITEYKRTWRIRTREARLPKERKRDRAKRAQFKVDGRCSYCGRPILDDERESYNHKLCEVCKTIRRERMRNRRRKIKWERIV